MLTATTIPELQALDRTFQEICSDLAYPPGSIFRIALRYLPNWGICVTPENIDWIKEAARISYEEWRRGTKATNDAIHRATESARLPYSNPDINLELAFAVTEILSSAWRRDGLIKIGDVGAGAGDTTNAILDAMNLLDGDGSLIRRCKFHLIESSVKRLADAEEMLKGHAINEKAPVARMLIADDIEQFVDMTNDGYFDLIVSNAVCHHIICFRDYLEKMRKKLTDDGIFVVGDWHTAIWSQPAFVLKLLVALGISEDKKRKFEYVFGLKRGDASTREHDLEPYHVSSNRMMVDYEVAIADQFRKIPRDSRLSFLEGHVTLSDRLADMNDAGFEFDLEELRQKHKAFVGADRTIRPLFPQSDFATVVAAAKIPGHKPGNGSADIDQRIRMALDRRRSY